jgi:hypothetical protein
VARRVENINVGRYSITEMQRGYVILLREKAVLTSYLRMGVPLMPNREVKYNKHNAHLHRLMNDGITTLSQVLCSPLQNRFRIVIIIFYYYYY